MTRIAIAVLVLAPLGLASPALAADDWVILAGASGCWSNNPSHPAVRKLVERSLNGRRLTGVAFTPHDEWVVLVGGNEFYYSQDLPACKQLRDWWKNPDAAEYRCVAFTPFGGWVVLADDNTFHAHKIPADARAKLAELQKAKTPIRSIAFTPDGGWAILGTEGDNWHSGLPEAAARRLDALAQSKTPVLCTAFDFRGTWIIIADRNGLWSNNTDHPAFRQLLDLKNKKVPLKWVALEPGEYPGDYQIVREPTNHVTAVVEMEVGYLGGRVDEWTVYGPVAPSHGGQQRMKTSMAPHGKPVEELSSMKRSVLLTHVRGAPRPLRTSLTIEGDLYARRLYPRPPGLPAEPDLDPADRRLYTRATEHINFENMAFQEFLDRADLRRRPGERDLTFARRTAAFIRDEFTYVYPTVDEHAVVVCDRRKSDCGGLSIVLVAVLRANNIPARMLQGRWAASDDVTFRHAYSVPGQYHVKSEFFAAGAGWVPVDMAAAVCDKDNGPLAYFGNDPGDFITTFIGPDYEVDAPAGRVNGLSLQGMLWFWKGEGVPRFGLQEHWTVSREAVRP